MRVRMVVEVNMTGTNPAGICFEPELRVVMFRDLGSGEVG